MINIFNNVILNNSIIVALFIFSITYNPLMAHGKTVQTISGDVILRMDGKSNNCNVLLNTTELLSFDCDGASLPKVLKDFRGKFGSFGEVLILQEVPLGNACNGGPLHVISLRKDKTFKVSKPLDFCGGENPAIKREADVITIVFPGGPKNRGVGGVPTEEWIYHNGKVKKSK